MQASAKAQPNIALIKYWGKRDTVRNLPAVGSISITLDALYTEMDISFDRDIDRDVLTVNGALDEAMLPRISRCLDTVAGDDRIAARIDSRINFPVAAGLASSASAFAAAVVASAAAAGIELTTAELARLAGQASGSAARSLYGGFVELENDGDDIAVASLLPADTWPLKVVIAITASGPKPLGSGDAMEISRKTSPFYRCWVDEQAQDLVIARSAIENRDIAALADIAEHNCLKMHSVMWTSRPAVVYWNAATLECLRAVRDLRERGVGTFFTVDAGPQVKAICLAEDEARVRDTLQSVPGVVSIITSGLGAGARLTGPL